MAGRLQLRLAGCGWAALSGLGAAPQAAWFSRSCSAEAELRLQTACKTVCCYSQRIGQVVAVSKLPGRTLATKSLYQQHKRLRQTSNGMVKPGPSSKASFATVCRILQGLCVMRKVLKCSCSCTGLVSVPFRLRLFPEKLQRLAHMSSY